MVYNICARKYYDFENYSSIVSFILILPLFQISILDQASNWYNVHWCFITLAFYFLTIKVLSVQKEHGALFFLPDSCRTMVFEQKLCILSLEEVRESPSCEICLNSLSMPELDYFDREITKGGRTFKRRNYPIGTYIETDCGHKFHVN